MEGKTPGLYLIVVPPFMCVGLAPKVDLVLIELRHLHLRLLELLLKADCMRPCTDFPTEY